MAIFPANPKRLDPYKNFKFRLKWDGVYVAGISKMGMLKRTTEDGTGHCAVPNHSDMEVGANPLVPSTPHEQIGEQSVDSVRDRILLLLLVVASNHVFHRA